MSEPYKRIPEQPQEKHIVSIPLILTVPLTAQNGVSVGIPTTPFKITHIVILFPNDAINNIQVRFLTSENSSVSTTDVSGGANILRSMAGAEYYIGHADAIHLPFNVSSQENERYIKMHVVNNNAYAITIQSIVTVEVG